MSHPIIITAEMGKPDQAWANSLRRVHFPPERNFLDAHITLFHHLPPGHLAEIKSRLSALASDCPPPLAKLNDVMLLGRGVAYRIESPELTAIRDELAEEFRGLLIPQDEARPRFHITIQNKVEPAVAKALVRSATARGDKKAWPGSRAAPAPNGVPRESPHARRRPDTGSSRLASRRSWNLNLATQQAALAGEARTQRSIVEIPGNEACRVSPQHDESGD